MSSYLKKLTIDNSESYSKDNLLFSLNKLKKFEKIVLNHMNESVVSKRFFDFISCNLISNLIELKYLDLFWCKGITDNDLKLICNLSKLEVLNISRLEFITGFGIGNFSNLKKKELQFLQKFGK